MISTLDITADSPLMTKHTIPIPLLDTSQRPSLGNKWRIASCGLALTLGHNHVLRAIGSEAAAQPATVSQPRRSNQPRRMSRKNSMR